MENRDQNQKKKLVLFTEEIKHKNQMMLEVLGELDVDLTIFYAQKGVDISKTLPSNAQAVQMKPSFFARTKQIFNFFKKNKLSFYQVYSGLGRYCSLYSIIGYVFKVPTLLIERGGGTSDLYTNQKTHPFIRMGTKLQYRTSKNLIYKEPYMLQFFNPNQFDQVFFLPNAIKNRASENKKPFSERSIDYLWVNRVIPLRKLEWIIEIAQKEEFKDKKFVVSGFLNDTYSDVMKSYIEDLNLDNLEIMDYNGDIWSLYDNAKHFVLPSELTFGNNALLEAMSKGVVPIVSVGAGGIEDLIQDGKQGIISENRLDSFTQAMISSLNMDESQWLQLSNNAEMKIKEEYNEDQYKSKLKAIYMSLLEKEN